MRKAWIVGVIVTLSSSLSATDMSAFNAFKSEIYLKAIDQGVSEQVLNDFISNVQPYQKAVESDRNQAEFKKFLWEYLDGALSTARVENGQQAYQRNATMLAQIESQYGVPARVLTAIWGMETAYGGYKGKVPIANAMTTLAVDGRRKAFFEKQLFALLKLVDAGDVPYLNVEGSWAGGMGHTQFIPTTYLQFAVDGDGDGYRNLWTPIDALSSAANYLRASGWQYGEGWGVEVTLPDDFDYFLGDAKTRRSVQTWQSLGVMPVHSTGYQPTTLARLFVPAGSAGPKFLLFDNFKVIKRYNNSNSYALAVGLLSDRVARVAQVQGVWPNNAKKLRKSDVMLIQQVLLNKGFDPNGIDGIMGVGTQQAIRQYQQAVGMTPDGFLTNELFRQLVNGD